MMLSTLTDIAQQLGFFFIYGEKQAFNIIADDTDPQQVVMYHEGYVSGQSAQDQQGAWEKTYNLRIWLLFKNGGANDKPIDRLPRFKQLEPLMYDILQKLEADYILSNPVSFSEGINQTDKDLDGIRFVVNAKAKIPIVNNC